MRNIVGGYCWVTEISQPIHLMDNDRDYEAVGKKSLNWVT
jgi:hypothetical protein